MSTAKNASWMLRIVDEGGIVQIVENHIIVPSNRLLEIIALKSLSKNSRKRNQHPNWVTHPIRKIILGPVQSMIVL